MTAPIGIYVRVSRQGEREDERKMSPANKAAYDGASAWAARCARLEQAARRDAIEAS